MAVDDDFSFPTASDPFNRYGIDSPPLWRLSPATDRSRRGKADGDGEKIKINDRFKFAAQTQRRRRFSSDAVADEEEAAEKMDVLWENFNEELSRSRRSRLTKSPESMEDIVKARRMGGCAAELSLSESSGAVATARKTGKTVIVKALKKLFLLHNNSRRKLQTPSR